MGIFTDRQREKIDKQGYESHNVGNPVTINDNGKDITIGYVVEVERS